MKSPFFSIGFRYVKGRLVESLLVVLGISLGVGITASVVTLVQSFLAHSDYALSSPEYREITVQAKDDTIEVTEAVLAVPDTDEDSIRLQEADIRPAVEMSPSVSYGYLQSYERFTVGESMFGQMRGAFGGQRTTVSVAASGAESSGESSEPNVSTWNAGNGAFFMQGSQAAGNAEPGASGEAAGNTPEGFVPNFGEGGFPMMGGEDTAGSGESESGTAGPRFDQEAVQNAMREMEALMNDTTEWDTPLIEEFSGMRVTADFFLSREMTCSEGSLFTDADTEAGNRVMVVGSNLAKSLYENGEALQKKVKVNGLVYTIIGVLDEYPFDSDDGRSDIDDLAFVPQQTNSVFGQGSIVMMIGGMTRDLTFSVADTDDLESAVAQLEAYFEQTYGADSVVVESKLEEAEETRRKHTLILSVLLFLAGAGLLIASINLFNLMVTRVLKRTKSIGIFRALGWSKKGIFRLFVTEVGILCASGGIVGALASPLLYRLFETYLVSAFRGMSVNGGIAWPILIAASFAAMLLSSVFGILPAVQASNTNTVDAIRME